MNAVDENSGSQEQNRRPRPQDESKTVSLYQAHKKIYPRSVSGLFNRWRWFFVFLTQAVYYLTPWLQWGDRQAILLDLPARRFYIFGLILFPQDVIYLTGILIVSALSLFLFTAVAGRQWCGYACPQTVYTEIFLRIERFFEGDRSARMRLDKEPMSGKKFMRKAGKHITWIVLALWTGFTLVGYFTPIRELFGNVLAGDLGPWESFWIPFYAFATYGFAGHMREQVCKYMCPYARFQSAMFDKDTLIVSYDAARGEPRGARSKKVDPKTAGLGDCVNCSMCTQVCPTGIDIRNGLQYECISCAACVDACDEVMRKVGYPTGLIRYTTESALKRGDTQDSLLKHIFRVRVLIYCTILAVVIGAFVTSLILRTPFKVDVVRDRAALGRVIKGGTIENIYRIQIMNATEKPQTYHLSVHGIDGLKLVSDHEVTVDGAQSHWVTAVLHLPGEAAKHAHLKHGSHHIKFVIRSQHHKIDEKSKFIVPRRR